MTRTVLSTQDSASQLPGRTVRTTAAMAMQATLSASGIILPIPPTRSKTTMSTLPAVETLSPEILLSCIPPTQITLEVAFIVLLAQLVVR